MKKLTLSEQSHVVGGYNDEKCKELQGNASQGTVKDWDAWADSFHGKLCVNSIFLRMCVAKI